MARRRERTFNAHPDSDRTCTSSMYTTTYDQIMPEFGCSQEVATLGLSFFIWGLGELTWVPQDIRALANLTNDLTHLGIGIGPLFLSPLSEVGFDAESSQASEQLMADFLAVLRPTEYLHHIFHPLFDLADPMRCCEKYCNHARLPLLQRLGWKRVSECRRGYGGRSV